MGIWQRAVENHKEDEVRNDLEELSDHLKKEEASDDLRNGLRWIARTLDKAIDDGTAVSSELPTCDEAWGGAIDEAADALSGGLPEWFVEPTRTLFRHALLQNSGVERRRAIDALRAAGLVEPFANQLLLLLTEPAMRPERWLRIRVLFALGFVRDGVAPADAFQLMEVCRSAAEAVMGGHADRGVVAELHEALFTVAELFGVNGIEREDAVHRSGEVRDKLGKILADLIVGGHTVQPDHRLIARAAAYLLTFTAQPGENDLSRRLLVQLRDHHTDDVTKRFCTWAMDFRWGAKYEVQPLLRGADVIQLFAAQAPEESAEP
jgi:hypothetical protein